jgi:cellulose synthase/poly-beta-1,6-N-acetylglucosamine synthase-like glycosyltransferase
VSVVVAARNEEQFIALCLDALVDQSYPKDRYELIFVNDRSTDRTAEIIESYQQKHPRFIQLHMSEKVTSISPKKHALETGIRRAKGEIILTTDADCIPAKFWIQTMVNFFETDVGLVAGFSPTEAFGRQRLFSKLLTLDSISLAALTASSFSLGRPLTVSGRNLAYRKKVFQAVNGFQEISHHISGDDDLFLHQVAQKTNWKFRYAFDPRALVKTRIPDSCKQFAQQRIRHASKGRFYSRWLKLFLAWIYLFNLLLVALLIISFFSAKFFWLWLVILLIKSISEFSFLFRFARQFNYQKIFYVFPIAALLHPFYVVVFGAWGQFGKIKWKE